MITRQRLRSNAASQIAPKFPQGFAERLQNLVRHRSGRKPSSFGAQRGRPDFARISFSNAMPQVSGGHLRGFPDCGDVTAWRFMFTRARAAQVCRSFSEAGENKRGWDGVM